MESFIKKLTTFVVPSRINFKVQSGVDDDVYRMILCKNAIGKLIYLIKKMNLISFFF